MESIKYYIIIILLLLPTIVLGQEEINNAIKVELQLLKTNPKNKEALRKVSFLYLNKADYNKAILYGKKLFAIGSAEKDYNHAVIYSHICLGQAQMMIGNAKEAYTHLIQARLIGESNKNDSALCSVYNGLGLYASNVQKDYYLSLTYFFKGVEAAKRSQYDRLYSIILVNISGIYYLKNDPSGLKYALECYDLGHKRKDAYLIYSGSTNVAYMYYLKKDYPTALKYIQEAEFIMIQNDFYDQSNIYNLYGYILSNLNRDEEAISYFKKALKLKEQGQTSSVMNAYLGYAKILIKQRNYSQAIQMLNIGIELSNKQESPIYRSDILKSLSQCYEATGMFKEALTYHKLFQIENDSSYNADKERAVGEIRVKYDVEKQQNEIKKNKLILLQKEKKEQLLISIIVAIILISLPLYYMYWRKNRFYLTIVRQNKEAVRREQQLQKQIQTLENSNLNRCDNDKEEITTEKYASSSLTEEKKSTLFLKLEKLMSEKRVYEDNLITKEKVAEQLESNRTYLSQAINEQTGQTFTQYINNYRINEAVRLLSDPYNQTPLKALSFSLGFNSMTTFYKLFQNAVGMTPSQYKERIQKLHKDN